LQTRTIDAKLGRFAKLEITRCQKWRGASPTH